MEKEHVRYYIMIRSKLGIKPVTIHEELVLALGDTAPSYTTVTRWASEFKQGRVEVKDDPRSGRPVTSFTKANIDRVRELVEADPHTTYERLEAETQLNTFTLHQILHQALSLRKVTSRWVPHLLTDENRQKRVEICVENLTYFRDGPGRLSDILTTDEVWIYHRQLGSKASNSCWIGPGESPNTVVKRGAYERKSMFSLFFRTSGIVHVHAVNRGRTIDHQYYIENCLSPALAAVRRERPSTGTKNLKLLQDNARPHIHSNVDNFLEDQGVKKIRHPPYSPDLAPCDFWLNDYIKRNLENQEDENALFNAVTKITRDIPIQEYQKTFQKWIERMELCIKNNGDYFEHLIK